MRMNPPPGFPSHPPAVNGPFAEVAAELCRIEHGSIVPDSGIDDPSGWRLESGQPRRTKFNLGAAPLKGCGLALKYRWYRMPVFTHPVVARIESSLLGSACRSDATIIVARIIATCGPVYHGMQDSPIMGCRAGDSGPPRGLIRFSATI